MRVQRHSWGQRLRRLLRYKLVIPLLRTPHPPEYVGLLWALTPLIPFQMYLAGATWAALRWGWKKDSSLLIALAWVWTTNIVTMGPVYYVFYVTGQMMRGRWDDLTGYQALTTGWKAALIADAGLWETAQAVAATIISEQGAALALGCLPYSLGGAVLGYVLTLRFVRRYQENKRRRLIPAEAAP